MLHNSTVNKKCNVYYKISQRNHIVASEGSMHKYVHSKEGEEDHQNVQRNVCKGAGLSHQNGGSPTSTQGAKC